MGQVSFLLHSQKMKVAARAVAGRAQGIRPHKTLYNRWKRWRCVAERHRSERSHEQGIFARMMVGLATGHGEERTVMIDATYQKAHRTASSLGLKKGGVDA